ncbi:MAG: preprotein translocase subunit YajC [Paramuribaculum sp.]|nr:preprotein translocase subunit YajC [Paramuribaculum sp.]
MTFNFITLDAATQAQGQAGGAGMMNLLMIVAIIAVFYFFMIRPQQKKQKEIRKFREGIQEGDRVVTAGGIYGKVRKIKNNTFSIEIAPNVCITVDKGSVYPSAVDAQSDAEADKK